MLTAVLLSALLVSCFAQSESDWVHVPGGWIMHKSCIYEMPEGKVLDFEEIKDRKCEYAARAPEAQVYAMDTEWKVGGVAVGTAMNTSWNCPALPVTQGSQTVYFWPGFKSDQPVMGYPVLQPVLQYGQHGKFWELQSWFVWGNNGVSYTGPAITMNPKENINSWMQYDASTQGWTVYGINTNSSKSSTLKVTNAQVGGSQFQYAMLVLETIMPTTSCTYYPAGGDTGVTFYGVSVNGIVPTWNPEITMKECQQKITIPGKGDVVQFTWQAP